METSAASAPANRPPPPPEGQRFLPGVSGNPSGRPSSKPLSDAYRRMLALPAPAPLLKKLGFPLDALKHPPTMADLIALGQGRAAVLGKDGPAREIGDRVEGKVPTQVTDADGKVMGAAEIAAEILALSAVARARMLAPDIDPEGAIDAEVVSP